MKKIEYTTKFREKVKRYIIGMLGQYGKPWEQLTELQKTLFDTDIERLTNGLLHETLEEYRNSLFNL